MRFKCNMCGYIYDECAEGKAFKDLPDTWICPMCGAGKEYFELIDDKCADD